jgi:1,4-dihydroxy-2-naphthoyl-CoA hydrolase
MPVDERTVQPMGIVHGGASVALAETLGSVAAWLSTEETKAAVGLEVNANHLRPVSSGWIQARCSPVHLGRTTQVWQIDLSDDSGRRTCVSRITMAVIDRPNQGIRPAPEPPG